jgi:site-specific recombinase XerD
MTPKAHPKTKSSGVINRFVAWLANNDLAQHTIRVYLSTLRQFAI